MFLRVLNILKSKKNLIFMIVIIKLNSLKCNHIKIYIDFIYIYLFFTFFLNE